jgi:capsular exopolysaccharide synthesis family protein
MENKKLNQISDDKIKVNIKETILLYFIYWKWFVLSLLICSGIAFIYLRYSKNIYQTSAQIKILDNKEGRMELPSDLNTLLSSSKVNLENEIGIIKSQRLLRRVVLALNLTTTYYFDGKIKSEELWDNCPFKIIWLNTQDRINPKVVEFSIELEKDGYKIVSEDQLSNQIFSFGQKNTAAEQSFILVLQDKVVPEIYAKGQFTINRFPLSFVVEDLSNNIKVSSTTKQSQLLSIVLNGENKDKSEAIINSIIDEFNKDGVADRQLISQRTIDFVNERFIYLISELDSIENNKQVFKKDNDLSYLPEDAKETISRKSITESEYFSLETQIALAKLLEEILKKDETFELLPSNLDIKNENINLLIADFNKAILERNKVLQSAGSSNPLVLAFSDKLMELKQNILYSIRVLQKQLFVSINNVESLKQDNASLLSSIPAKEKILRSIERQQNIKETLYLFLLQKREEASVSKAITTPSVKIVDYAISSFKPVAPPKNIIGLIALLLGLLIPIVIIFLMQMLDTKIHSKQDFDRLVPDIPVVAEIPFIQKDQQVIKINDRSVLAEAFRILRTNITYLMPIKTNGECPVVFTTSSIKGEGKTFVSLNLALTLSTMNKKVLLIGADLRNPQLHKYLNIIKKRIGLSNYLHDTRTDWKSLINEKVFNNEFLDIIFAGSVTPNPAELLSNGRFEELLNILKKEYDYIIVDTAPTILVADTLLISQLADLTVYVTQADYTDKKLLTYSLDLKMQGKLKNMAYVINKVGSSKGYGYGYGYNYGYDYGYDDDDSTVPKKAKWFGLLKNKS